MLPRKGSVHVAYVDVSCPCPQGLVEGELSCQLNGRVGTGIAVGLLDYSSESSVPLTCHTLF